MSEADFGEEDAECLDTINHNWRVTHWLHIAEQSIENEEVSWYELVTPLTSGEEGTDLALAKHLLTAWWWSRRVCGEDVCPPAPTALNLGQFITSEEVAEGMGEPLWFMAYSHTLQHVEEAAWGRKWEWP